MNVTVVKDRFLALRMRWRVLLVLLVLIVISTITGEIAEAGRTDSPGYVDGYDYGRDFYDLRRGGETPSDYCRRLTWEAGPVGLGVEYVNDFHLGCEDAIDAG
jgi:hypothetical protein